MSPEATKKTCQVKFLPDGETVEGAYVQPMQADQEPSEQLQKVALSEVWLSNSFACFACLLRTTGGLTQVFDDGVKDLARCLS